MKVNAKLIIIANTNTTNKEMKSYEEMANTYNYMIFHVVLENRHGNSNVHNVPEETINKMVSRFNIKLV